jgi:phosphoglycerate kinase
MAIPDDWIGVDIGPRTVSIFSDRIKKSKTLFWNGPMGIFEMDPFSEGTTAIAKSVKEATQKGCITVLGGGDTLSALKKSGVKMDEVSHCSTGGGASLEFIEGKLLPGLKALDQNEKVN